LHQNQSGEVHISEVAYTVGTTSNATARQTPLVWTIDHVVCGGGAMHSTRAVLLSGDMPYPQIGGASRRGGDL